MRLIKGSPPCGHQRGVAPDQLSAHLSFRSRSRLRSCSVRSSKRMSTKDTDQISFDNDGQRLRESRYSELFQVSVEAILRNQSASGAIVASPDFAQYHFCWLRDGSFCSYALDRAEEYEASSRYHAWVNEAIGGISGIIDDVIEKMLRGERIEPSIMPPARFALDGTSVIDDWPNFQIDGYGTWLWSLGQHLRATNQLTIPKEWLSSVARASRYLATFALTPCYDVWEESGTAVHTSTLACVYGGLTAAAVLLDDSTLLESALVVQRRLSESIVNGVYTKSSENGDVDSSELWLLTPFQAVDVSDQVFAKTVTTIDDRLSLDGGLRRYATDTYFGSGAWPVLTASLGWHYVNIGNLVEAQTCLDWLARRFDANGNLGEQFGGQDRDVRHYNEWVDRWGTPAADLTWSHAMYVILADAISRASGGAESRLTTKQVGADDSSSEVAK